MVCSRRYNGHELWVALGIIHKRGHSFEVVSTDTTIRDEITLKPNTVDRTVYKVGTRELNDRFDALMFISGNMKDTEKYWHDKHVQALVSGHGDRPLAAICCSVPTVRESAKGKKVSFFPLSRSKLLLKQAGAILNSVSVTHDQGLVTAETQMGTTRWARVFCDVLDGKEPVIGLIQSDFPEPMMDRRPIEAVERLKPPSMREEIRIPRKRRGT